MKKYNYSPLLFFVLLFFINACSNAQSNFKTFLDKDLSISTDTVKYGYNRNLAGDFFYSSDYFNKKLRDKKNGWTNKFSKKYFEVQVMYIDDDYVIVYCVISGIKNGYLLFPKKYNNLILIDRKTGSKIIDIETQNGIINSVLKNDIIYLECYDPHVTRYYKVEN